MKADRFTESDVIAFLDRYEHASSTKSFANVADMIHPDALFRFNDGDYRGLQAIQIAFERTWAYNVQDERYHLTNVEVMNRDANSAAVTFGFEWSGVGADGPFHHVGRGTMVLVRHDCRLKILVEHLSR